jgi:hypothetical protein
MGVPTEPAVPAAPAPARAFRRHLHRLRRGLSVLALLLGVYLLLAYLVVPAGWRFSARHPALEQAPRITRTANGIAGDPLNVGLVGCRDEVVEAMATAGWHPADPITLRTCLCLTRCTLLHRPYEEAPVSNLFVWGRRQDLAFQQAAGGDPRRRHHVRFWRSDEVDEEGRPLWFGAATYDSRVGLSHTTGQVTHHIAADVDTEREKLMSDLDQSGYLARRYLVSHFHTNLRGRNGGGDPYHTDGNLTVGVIALPDWAVAPAP